MLIFMMVYFILSSVSPFAVLSANEEGGKSMTRSRTCINASLDVIQPTDWLSGWAVTLVSWGPTCAQWLQLPSSTIENMKNGNKKLIVKFEGVFGRWTRSKR
jgi:hypothetical protein